MDFDYWRCPHCGALHSKNIRQGPIQDRLPGNLVTYHVSHQSGCPKCGGDVSGADIAAGRHDAYLPELVASPQASFGCGCLGWLLVAFFAGLSGVKFFGVAILAFAVGFCIPLLIGHLMLPKK